MQQSFWDQRYAEPDLAYGAAANVFLTEQAFRMNTGARVLVPADGQGRNGVWLAEQGFEVVSLDLSAVAVRRAQALAAERGVRIDARVADLSTFTWQAEQFDAAVLIFAHLPSALRLNVHRGVWRSLRSGGVLVLQAFTPAQLRYREVHNSGGPADRDMTQDVQSIHEDFPGAQELVLEERDRVLQEGVYHSGLAAVVEAVLRKP